ncbi:MAG TPA: hypothetical protein VJ461_05400 [Candidatus Nanoarchaeia archaeon]|nr:hypothetical protein [Candidatus Nanoarchaeia archaeon]
MYGKTIAIPELGIESYFISNDLEIGCCSKDKYQGVLVDGKHYLIDREDVHEGTPKGDLLIPRAAYELYKVVGSKGKVRDVVEPSVLEKIALAIESEPFEGESTHYAQTTH